MSHRKEKYFYTFIDDFIRKFWVYFLEEKLGVFQAFKEFTNLVENQSGYPLEVLRSDRGGEYTSHEFETFNKEKGIWYQSTL